MVTIILLIILATISIGIVMQSGIIDKAEVVKDEALLAQYKETIKMITLSEYTKKVTEGNKDLLKDMVKKRVLEEEWAESAEDVADSNNKIKVTTKDNHVIIAEIDDFGNVIIDPDADKEPSPSIEVSYYGKNEGKYQIKASATVEKTEKTTGVITLELVEKNQVINNYEDGKEVIFEVDAVGEYWIKATTNYGKSTQKSIEIKDDESTDIKFDVVIDQDSFIYDGTEKKPNVTVKDGKKVLVENTDYTVSYKNNINVGTGEVTVTGKGKYSKNIETRTFVINKVEVEIPMSPEDKTYNGEEQTNGIKISSNASVVTANSTVKATNAGTYTVEYSLNDTENYEWKDKTTENKKVTWKINAYDINNGTIEDINAQKYNGEEQKPEVTVTVPIPSGKTTKLVKDTDYTVEYSNNINAGTGKVIVIGKGNYTGKVEKTFTIGKANGYVTLDANKSVIYGTESTTFAVKASHGGTISVSDDNSTATSAISGTTVTISNLSTLSVGTTVKVTVNVAATTNYKAASAVFTLTIGKAINPITVTANTLTYNGKAQNLVTTAKAQGTVYYSVGTALTSSNYSTAGSTTIPTKTGANTSGYVVYYYCVGNSNYNAKSGNVTVKINKANLTVTADNKTMTYGGTVPTCTYKVSGYVNNETSSVLGGTVSYAVKNSSGTTVTVSKTTNAGTYTITPSGLSATNYSITYKAGTLTINKATATMKVSNTSKIIQDGSNSTFTYTYNGDGAVTVKSSDNSIATCSVNTSTKTVTVNALKTSTKAVTITVSAAAGTNYNAISKTVQIGAIVISGVPTSWTNKDQKITATTTLTGHTVQTMKDTGSWQTASSQTFTANGTFFARVLNSSSTSVGSKSINITKIDKIAPEITKTGAEINKNVITVSMVATDNSGETPSYWYNIDGGTFQKTNTFTVSGIQVFTIGYKAIDAAGNETVVYKKGTNGYTITYDANGGTGAPASQTKMIGENLTLSSTVPTKTGYTFLGWSTSSTATTATYAKGATYTENKTATLYAVWQVKTVKVTFMRNIDSSDTTSNVQTFTYGVTGQKFSDKGWTRTGYTLLGWSTDKNATSKTFELTSSVDNSFINARSPAITLYAVWKLDNVAPTAPTTSVTSRNTNSFVVNAKSTDNDGDKLIYKLYTKAASASGYTLSATSASTASGTAVNLTASKLSSYTVYTYYVTASDGKATEKQSAVKTTGTACSGTGYKCSNKSSIICSETVHYLPCGGTITGHTSSGGGSCSTCGSMLSSVTFTCSECGPIPGGGTFCGKCSTQPSPDHGAYKCEKHGYIGSKKEHVIKYDSVTTVECGATLYCDKGTQVSYRTDHTSTVYKYFCQEHNVTWETTLTSGVNHPYTVECTHTGYDSNTTHYYCTTHGYVGTSDVHSYCSHGKIGMHYPN